MSDIVARCIVCGKELVVSEFVDMRQLKCPSCGGAMAGERSGVSVRRPPTVVKKRQRPEPATAQTAEGAQKRPAFKRRRRRKLFRIAKYEVSNYACSWALFALLAPVAGYFRWGDVLGGPDLGDFVDYGLVAFGILHLVILVEACREDMFDGILAFFIPPYAWYYLFTKSDSFVLRALLGVVTVAVGYDLYLYSYEMFTQWFTAVDDWIHQDWEDGKLPGAIVVLRCVPPIR